MGNLFLEGVSNLQVVMKSTCRFRKKHGFMPIATEAGPKASEKLRNLNIAIYNYFFSFKKLLSII